MLSLERLLQPSELIGPPCLVSTRCGSQNGVLSLAVPGPPAMLTRRRTFELNAVALRVPDT